MAVKFKGISEYKSKFKGRSARSRSASPQLMMRKAGLRSDQKGVCREPQFHSKRRVPSQRLQAYQSFQWEGPEELPRERRTPRPSTTPAAAPPAVAPAGGDAEGAQTPLAPRGPRPSEALCEGNEPIAQAPPPAAEPRSAVSVEEAEPALNGVHHVLKRRAGLRSAGRANRLLSSEYQRQFQRKTPAASCPLLTAEQVVYGSSPVIPPFKANPLVQESEYRRNFKGSPPTRAPRLRRDLEQREGAQIQPELVSPERAAKNMKRKKKQQQQLSRKPSLQNGAPQCGSPSQRRETRSQSPPPQPRPSRGGYRKVRSEYSSHFRSPPHHRLRDGVWIRSSTAAAEARELREKAEAYRRRAWGTHFSRDHLNQILSEQNRLWEASTASDTGTIRALDLASIESVRGSTGDRRSPPRSTPASRRSSLGGSEEEAGLHNAPTLPVRRKLAWGEAEQGAGPEQKDRDETEKPGEGPRGGKRREELEEEEEQEEEEDRSDKTTASEDRPPSPTSDSQSSALGGRLPTPKMKTIATIQRTHHDRTTPTTGGAILVSPPKLKEASPGRTIRRSEPPLGKPHSPLSRAAPERVSSKVEGSSSPHSPPAAGLSTADPIPMREDVWPAALPSPAPSPAALPSPAPRPAALPSPAPRPAGTSRGRSPTAAAAATPPLLPASAPTNRILGKLRDPEFQHNGNLGLVRHKMADVSSADLSDDDDRMSQISAWSAASCSMASQVLERAQKRQNSFWGKS